MRIADLSIGKVRAGNNAAGLEPRRVRTLARSWRAGGLGLVLLCLLVYVPGLWTIPPIDRDESRFAQASRQMLESGTLSGWIVPMVQDRPRLNKPPLIYWLQAGSAWLLGDAPDQWAWLDGESENIWVYRVPSVLAAMMTVLLTWRLGVRMFDPRAAWLGAALLGVCPMVVWDAHQARADQVLLAMTTGTMLCLWVVWKREIERGRSEPKGASPRGVGRDEPDAEPVDRASCPEECTANPTGRDARSTDAAHPEECTVNLTGRDARSTDAARDNGHTPEGLRPSAQIGWGWPILFWIFLTLGVMTKGPITPMVAGLTAVSLSLVTRRWRWLLDLKPVVGVVILVSVVGPWVYGVTRVLEDPTLQQRMGIVSPRAGEPARSGFSAYWSIIYAETIGRSAGAKEGHWGPPGYHIVLLGVLFWPGSLLTAAGIGRAWKRGLVTRKSLNAEGAESTEKRKKWSLASLRASVASWFQGLYHSRAGRPAELFCLAWMLPSWIVFEVVSTKLPHYTMPLYPAVALISARMVFAASSPAARRVSEREREKGKEFLSGHDAKCRVCGYSLRGLQEAKCPECSEPFRLGANGDSIDHASVPAGQRRGNLIWLVIGVLMTMIVPSGLLWLIHAPLLGDANGTVVLLGVVGLAPGLCIVALFGYMLLKTRACSRRGCFLDCVAFGVVCAVMFECFTFRSFLPKVEKIWISSAVVRVIQKAGTDASGSVAALGCGEESLVFQMRGNMRRLYSHDEAADWLLAEAGRVLLVPESELLRLQKAVRISKVADNVNLRFETVSGWNYSIGRVEQLVLVWRRP